MNRRDGFILLAIYERRRAARLSAGFGGPLAVARRAAAGWSRTPGPLSSRTARRGSRRGPGLRLARDQLDLRAFAQFVRTVDDDHVTRREPARDCRDLRLDGTELDRRHRNCLVVLDQVDERAGCTALDRRARDQRRVG